MSPEKIPSWINEFCAFFPCMIQKVNGNGLEINWGKVAQALVIVAIIASSTSFVTVKVLESQFADLKVDIREDVRDMKDNIKNIINNESEFEKDVNKQFDDIAKNVTKIETEQSKQSREFRDRLGKLEAR